MTRAFALALMATVFATPALATLKPGDAATSFTAQAALAGNEFTFSLDEALKTGPVVLYFYPAAFTKGCSLEARAFAEATDEFKALGATVIGMSKDDIETLKKFSTADCGSKFAVGSDESKKVMEAYDAVLLGFLPMSERTSYVITPDKKINFTFSALSHEGHVENTLAAVKKWRETNPMPTASVAPAAMDGAAAEPAKQ
jgi:thioredoxin-dependent peroxiredoxin